MNLYKYSHETDHAFEENQADNTIYNSQSNIIIRLLGSISLLSSRSFLEIVICFAVKIPSHLDS